MPSRRTRSGATLTRPVRRARSPAAAFDRNSQSPPPEQTRHRPGGPQVQTGPPLNSLPLHLDFLQRDHDDETASNTSNVSSTAHATSIYLASLIELEDIGARAGISYYFFTWKYLSRLLAAVLFWFLAAMLNTLASVCAGYRTPWLAMRDLDGNETSVRTLPDAGHDLWAHLLGSIDHPTPYLDWYALPDLLVYYAALATLILVSVHPQRFMIVRRVFLLLGYMMLLRAVSVTVTQLPDASPSCQSQFTDTVRGAYKRRPLFPVVFYRTWTFFWAPARHVTCGDMVFSGHTTCLMMSAMVFKRYCKAKWMKTKIFFRRAGHTKESLCTCIRWAAYVYCGFGSLLIIGTRLHYTLDVIVALFATHAVFNHYHSYLRYKRLKEKGWGVLRWFEAEEISSIESWAYDRATEMD